MEGLSWFHVSPSAVEISKENQKQRPILAPSCSFGFGRTVGWLVQGLCNIHICFFGWDCRMDEETPSEDGSWLGLYLKKKKTEKEFYQNIEHTPFGLVSLYVYVHKSLLLDALAVVHHLLPHQYNPL